MSYQKDKVIYTVKYNEYDSKIAQTLDIKARGQGSLPIKTGEFEISLAELALAVAKAMITKSNKYDKEINLLAESFTAIFPLLLSQAQSGPSNLRINSEFEKKCFVTFQRDAEWVSWLKE